MLSGMISSVGGKVDTTGTNISIDSDAVFHADAAYNIGIGAQTLQSTNNDAADNNIAIGYQAGKAITEGGDNVAIGHTALKAATHQDRSVVVGYQAGLVSNSTDANGLIAIGWQASKKTTDARYITAIGYRAGAENVTGDALTAIGYKALENCTVAGNTMVGYQAGEELTTGTANTVIGYNALAVADDTENSNVVVGYNAMSAAKQGTHASAACDDNVAIGYNALLGGDLGSNNYSLTGNVAIGLNALDATATKGAIGNVAIGYNAATSLVADGSNTEPGSTYIGFKAGQNFTESVNNTMIGYNVGHVTITGTPAKTGSNANVFVGYGAAGRTTWASADTGDGNTDAVAVTNNVAVGFNAMSGALSGAAENTMVGYQAGFACKTGYRNTFLGMNAGVEITDGQKNIAIGALCMDDTSNYDGQDNIAIGYTSMSGAWAGRTGAFDANNRRNIAIGTATLDSPFNNTNNNVAIGYNAGRYVTGSSNTFIGYQAADDNDSGSPAVFTGAGNVAIGVSTSCLHNAGDQIAIGNTAVTSAGTAIAIGSNITNSNADTVKFGDSGANAASEVWTGSGTWEFTMSSDLRKKRNIKDNTLGLDFINELETKTFQWKPQNEVPEEWACYSETNEWNLEEVHIGFIAQDVKSLLDKYNAQNAIAGWNQDPDGMQRLGETKLITPLIKAVQELSAQVEELKSKIGEA